jgi:hypothetical protein
MKWGIIPTNFVPSFPSFLMSISDISLSFSLLPLLNSGLSYVVILLMDETDATSVKR